MRHRVTAFASSLALAVGACSAAKPQHELSPGEVAPSPNVADSLTYSTECRLNPANPAAWAMDTVATSARSGQRLVIRTAFASGIEPTWRSAEQAAWYRDGRPLGLSHSGFGAPYTAFGSLRAIDPADLVLLTVRDSLPIFVDRGNAPKTTSFIERLTPDQRAIPWDAFEDLAEDVPYIHQELRNLVVLYVPANGTACTFQPVQRVQWVRKTAPGPSEADFVPQEASSASERISYATVRTDPPVAGAFVALVPLRVAESLPSVFSSAVELEGFSHGTTNARGTSILTPVYLKSYVLYVKQGAREDRLPFTGGVDTLRVITLPSQSLR